MLDIIIGLSAITISIYGLKEYYKLKKINRGNSVHRQNTNSIRFASILGIIIGIAFILRGLGLLDGGGF